MRDIATWQTRHDHAGDDVGLTTSADGQNDPSWEALNTRLVHTKARLDHRDPPTVMWPHQRSHHQLVARRIDLDQTFDTAPNDQQALITRLRRGDPQLLDDTAETLKAAIETQHSRRHWILEHWPHIIEYAEITNTLTHQLWGPDTTTILAPNREAHSPRPERDLHPNPSVRPLLTATSSLHMNIYDSCSPPHRRCQSAVTTRTSATGSTWSSRTGVAGRATEAGPPGLRSESTA